MSYPTVIPTYIIMYFFNFILMSVPDNPKLTYNS